MQVDRTWGDWLKWHLDQAPFQILHMRELAEHTIRAQDTSAVSVDGSGEKDRLPYNAQAADDADALYIELVLFAREVADHTGLPSPRPVRAGMWQGATEPQGLPVCRPDEAFAWSGEIRTWLVKLLPDLEQLAHDGKLGDAPDHLAATIRKMRARYPDTPPPPRRYLNRGCPTCGERGLHLAVAGTNPIVRCEECRDRWAFEDFFP